MTAALIRECPFCSRTMNENATLCTACGRFSVGQTPPSAEPEESLPLIDRLNSAVAQWDHTKRDEPVRFTIRAAFPRPLRIGLAAALLACSTVFVAIWLKLDAGFIIARAAMAFIVVGVVLLLGSRTLKEAEPPVTVDRPSGSPWLLLLGYANNLAVAQLCAMGAMIVFAVRREIDAAWWAAVIAVLLVVPLYRSKASRASIAMAAVGLVYLLYALIADDIGRTIAARAYARGLPELIVPVADILWTALAIALVPQLQLLRIVSIGIGRFRGDTNIRLFGSTVPIALVSATLLVCAWWVITALPHVPASIRIALDG